jgi:hypothetical protein
MPRAGPAALLTRCAQPEAVALFVASIVMLSVGILEPVERVLKAWPTEAAGSSGVVPTLPGRMPVCAARAAALVVIDTPRAV